MDLETIEKIRLNDPELAAVDLSDAKDLSFVEGNTTLEYIVISGKPKKNFDSVLRIPSLRKLRLGRDVVDDLESFRTATLQDLVIQYGKITSLEPLRFNTSLKSLDLTSNDVESLDILTTNTTLVELHLDNNEINSLGPLYGNTTLKTLYVEDSNIESIEPLRGNSVITHLRLIANPVEDISPLTGNMAVVSLGLDRTLMEDISPLGSMLNLRSLSISGTSIDNIHPLKWCIALEDIQMNHTRVSDMSSLGCLPRLVKIEARNNRFVTDIAFLKGTNIKTVIMADCSIRHIPDLGECLHLEELNLRLNSIETADTWSHSGCHITPIEVILSGNSLTNIDFLRRCTYIGDLLISNNKLTNIDAIEYIYSIRRIVAHNNNITHIPSTLPRSLRSLHLEFNNIRDISPLWGNTRVGYFSYVPQKCLSIAMTISSITSSVNISTTMCVTLHCVSPPFVVSRFNS